MIAASSFKGTEHGTVEMTHAGSTRTVKAFRSGNFITSARDLIGSVSGSKFKNWPVTVIHNLTTGEETISYGPGDHKADMSQVRWVK